MIGIEQIFLAGIPVFIFIYNIKYYFVDTTPDDVNEIDDTWYVGLGVLQCPSFIASLMLPLVFSIFGIIYWILCLLGVLGLFIICDINKYIWHKIHWLKWLFLLIISTQALLIYLEPEREMYALYLLFAGISLFVAYVKITNSLSNT